MYCFVESSNADEHKRKLSYKTLQTKVKRNDDSQIHVRVHARNHRTRTPILGGGGTEDLRHLPGVGVRHGGQHRPTADARTGDLTTQKKDQPSRDFAGHRSRRHAPPTRTEEVTHTALRVSYQACSEWPQHILTLYRSGTGSFYKFFYNSSFNSSNFFFTSLLTFLGTLIFIFT